MTFCFCNQVLKFYTRSYTFVVTVVLSRGTAITSYQYCIWLLTRILPVKIQYRVTMKCIQELIYLNLMRLRRLARSQAVFEYCYRITAMVIGTDITVSIITS